MKKIISVISDTHGKLRQNAMAKLYDSDLILHLGDVGDVLILERLQEISEVRVVKGNVDEKIDELKGLSNILEFSYERFNFLMVHNIMDLNIKDYSKPDIVLYGHSHMPYEKVKDGVLYLNPGSIGPKRFTLPVSMLKIYIDSNRLNLEWIELENIYD